MTVSLNYINGELEDLLKDFVALAFLCEVDDIAKHVRVVVFGQSSIELSPERKAQKKNAGLFPEQSDGRAIVEVGGGSSFRVWIRYRLPLAHPQAQTQKASTSSQPRCWCQSRYQVRDPQQTARAFIFASIHALLSCLHPVLLFTLSRASLNRTQGILTPACRNVTRLT